MSAALLTFLNTEKESMHFGAAPHPTCPDPMRCNCMCWKCWDAKRDALMPTTATTTRTPTQSMTTKADFLALTTEHERDVLNAIVTKKGWTMTTLGEAIGLPDPKHGPVQSVARALARLRAWGLVEPGMGRGYKDQELVATIKGVGFDVATWMLHD